MRHMLKVVMGAALAVGFAGSAHALVNNGPPGQAYDVVLDLAGTTVGSGYTQYNATFVATNATSTVTFAFRNDPGYFAFDNASVMDITNPSSNLLVNGDFENGSLFTATAPCCTSPAGWTFTQDPAIAGVNTQSGVYDTASAGLLGLTPQGGSNQFWADGAFTAYETLAQSFATTIGETYAISFWLNNSVGEMYQPTDTSDGLANGGLGNGMDLLVYAPDPIPEPASLALLGAGVLGIGLIRRRRA